MNQSTLLSLLVSLSAISAAWSADFVGPTIISCTITPTNPCLLDASVTSCGSSVNTAEPCVAVDPNDVPMGTSETFYLVLPCGCSLANNCPDTCQIHGSASGGTVPTPTAVQGSPTAGTAPGSPTAAVPGSPAMSPTSDAIRLGGLVGTVTTFAAVLLG